MKTLILLGGNIEAVPVIQRTRELEFRAVVVDGNPNAPGREIADTFINASCYSGDQTIDALRASGMTFDGVLCAAVDAPVACAEVAARFGLPGLSVEVARLSNNKWEQKKALYHAGIPIPKFQLITHTLETHPDVPMVLKPADSRGGRGVIRLLPGVDPSWAYGQAKAYSPTGRVMVEQWLNGPQLSTESIVQDGRILFTAVGLRNYARLDEFAPYVIEDGFDEPAQVVTDFGQHPPVGIRVGLNIEQIIESASRALGWYQTGAGTVKGDLVIHDGRVYVIELAARLSGGFFASHGHPMAYGVDFVGAAIKAALGYALEDPKPCPRGFVSQRYVFPEPDDIGKTVTRMRVAGPPLDDWPGKSEFATWNINAGDVIKPVTSHPDRWGQTLATGRTPDEARQRAGAAVSEMKRGVVLQ